MKITNELIGHDIAALKKILPQISCPMCKNSDFLVIDGFISNNVQKEADKIIIGREMIPTIALICSKCGFISQHAMGIIRDNEQTNAG